MKLTPHALKSIQRITHSRDTKAHPSATSRL